jgi:hypothetical protein
MIMQIESPVQILQQRLAGPCAMDEAALSAAAVLAERLQQLKALSPMFAGVSFSPDVEALLTADLAAAVN